MTDSASTRSATLHDWESAPTDHPAPLTTRQLVKGTNMMAARFVLEEGFDMEPHVHHNEQISIVVEGRLMFRVADVGSDQFRDVLVGPGQIMELPPYVPHAARALERTVVLDLFSPPSERTGIDRD